jgi:dihydrodipicolinate synthase/N-acetylneuraminate lyase
MTTLLNETVAENPSTPRIRSGLKVWSAAPTPLTSEGTIDVASLRRSVDHHVAIGCGAIMLGGTCGEGPWLRHSDLEVLVRTGVEQAAGRINIMVQATDNSSGLILERLDALTTWGAQHGVVAQPHFFMNANPTRLREFYLEIWERSPLPVIFYDRGQNANVPVPLEILDDILHHPRVVGMKDSASHPDRFAISKKVREDRPEFFILNGNEFQLLPALQAGYDGAFFGGMTLTALAVRRCMDLLAAGDEKAAVALDEEIQRVLFDVYGGPKITCWLAGLKYALVKLGVFTEWKNIPGYSLTDECRQSIDKAVATVEWLHPK